MNADQIHRQFVDLIATGKDKAVKRTAIGLSQAKAATYRYNIENNLPVSMELKMYWLQKAGIPVHAPASYEKKDLLALVKFTLKASKAAKEQGAEYLVEKFLKTR